MSQTIVNLRSKEQNRKLWWLAGQLGLNKEAMANMISDLTMGRTYHSSELSYIEARNLITFLSKTLNPPNSVSSAKTDLDRKRKGVIKAIFRWLELRGISNVSVEYVKGIACRAAGRMQFNTITAGELTRIYAEFCRKQEAQSVIMNVELGIAIQN